MRPEIDVEIDLTTRVTKASFVLAYVEANTWDYCGKALDTWRDLHSRDVLEGEIDKDPGAP
jgi:hypothetical protein